MQEYVDTPVAASRTAGGLRNRKRMSTPTLNP